MRKTIDEQLDCNEIFEVGTISLDNLFRNKLSIPDFQRPYEWDDGLVLKLFEDIEKHFFPVGLASVSHRHFYLGSVMLNKIGKNHFDIVDGQQRLTTFVILEYLIDPYSSSIKNMGFTFHSGISVRNIIAVKKLMTKIMHRFLFIRKEFFRNIFESIIVTAVLTADENTALQFFDSLNTKGKKLDVLNILKSFHLRELNGEEHLQKEMASQFDRINAKVESRNYKGVNIESLDSFVSLLWVKQNNWAKGIFLPINQNTLQSFFRENSVSYSVDSRSLRLFPSIRNIQSLTASIEIDENRDFTFNFRTLEPRPLIEFNPLHPVQRGLGFFLSIESLEKYFDQLFVNCDSKELKDITNLVRSSFNGYFIHFYYMLVLGYYVKFASERLEEFSFEIEQILGNRFLHLQSVQRQSPEVIIREFNFLQNIYLSTAPDTLIRELTDYKNKMRVKNIQQKNDEVTLLTTTGKNSFKHHTSRPSYIRRALETYSKESNVEYYTALHWNNVNI